MILYNKVIPKKRPIQELEPELVSRILDSSWKYSIASVMHKLEEGYYFRKISPKSPSLEIGTGNFVTSLCFFHDRQIDVASDVRDFSSLFKQKSVSGIYKNYSLSDVHRIPFKNETFQDIILVHIVDHLPDINITLSELSRVLKKGGNLYFSGYSYYWKKLLKSKLDNKIPVFNSYHYNLFDEKEWEKKVNLHGMNLVDHGYFLTGRMAGFYRLTRFLYHAKRHGLDIFSKIPILDRWYEEMLLNLFIPLCERDLDRCRKNNNGIHIWLHAKK
jgi:SAM-dependent methyltransferase